MRDYKIIPEEAKEFILDNWGKMETKVIAEKMNLKISTVKTFYYRQNKEKPTKVKKLEFDNDYVNRMPRIFIY